MLRTKDGSATWKRWVAKQRAMGGMLNERGYFVARGISLDSNNVIPPPIKIHNIKTSFPGP